MSFIDYKHKKAEFVYALTFASDSGKPAWYKIISNLSLLPIFFHLSFLSANEKKEEKKAGFFCLKKRRNLLGFYVNNFLDRMLFICYTFWTKPVFIITVRQV